MAGGGVGEYGLKALEVRRLRGKYKGLTLLYALKGDLEVFLGAEGHRLPQGGVLLANSDTPYEVFGEPGNILIRLEVSNQYFARYYKNSFYYRYRLFPVGQTDVKAAYAGGIKRLMALMMMAEVGGSSEYALLESNRLLSELLLILVSAFKEAVPLAHRRFRGYSRRIENIVNFLQENYRHSISLQDLADREFVSFAYLSRLFKKEVGMNFMQYLTRLRFDNAVHALLNSATGIAQAAEENGFAGGRQFSQMFKAAYGKTPSEFLRERESGGHGQPPALLPAALHTAGGETDEVDESTAADTHLLVSLLSDVIREHDGKEAFLHYSPVEELLLNLGPKPGPPPPRLRCFLLVRKLEELLKSEVRAQIADLDTVTAIEAVEAFFPESGGIFSAAANDPAALALERAIAFLHKRDIGLHLHFAHQSVQHQDRYFTEIARDVRSCIDLFGPGYVASWRFIYYSKEGEAGGAGEGGSPEFAAGYAAFRDLLRACLPQAVVGIFFPFPRGEIEEMEAFCRTDLARSIDFLSYSAGFHEWGNLAEKLESDFVETAAGYVYDKTLRLSNCFKRHGLAVPLLLTKWNTLTGLTRHATGRFFRGALIVHTLLAVAPRVHGVGISLNTEILKEAQDEYIEVSGITPYYSGLTRRPLFFALQFLGRLRGNILSRSEEHLITETPFGYQLLFMNLTVFRPSLSLQEHMTHNFKKKKKIVVSGLKSGVYQVRRYVLDRQDGALYRRLERFSTRYGLDDEVFDYLERQTMPSLVVYDEEIVSGEWSILEDFDINAVHFYEMRRMRD